MAGRMSLRMLIRDERRPVGTFGCHLFFAGVRVHPGIDALPNDGRGGVERPLPRDRSNNRYDSAHETASRAGDHGKRED